jgi:hypothetical protein
MSRFVTINLTFNCEDSTDDETIRAFVQLLENEVGKASYDLDDIPFEIEGEYIPEDACQHDYKFIRSNDEGDSLYRCKFCQHEEVT